MEIFDERTDLLAQQMKRHDYGQTSDHHKKNGALRALQAKQEFL